MAATTARRCLLLLALYVCLVNYAEGASFIQPTRENPAHPGKCFDYGRNKAVAVGKSITDHSSCTELTCVKTKKRPPTFELHGDTCPYVTEIPSNCREVKGNLALNYPDCCSTVKCKGKPKGSLSMNG